MATFIMRQAGPPATFAVFEGDAVRFVASQDEATGFASKGSLEDAFAEAMKRMLAEARVKLAAAQKAKKTKADTRCGWDENGKRRMRAYGMADFIPSWLARMHGMGDSWSQKPVFVTDMKSSAEDWMGTFELFYARSEAGWLGGPRTKGEFGGFSWHSDMSRATGFLSEEACRSAAGLASSGFGRARGRGSDFAVLKSSCVFTEAKVPKGVDDGVARSVESACEARAIEDSIRELAEGRAKAALGDAGKARKGSGPVSI